MKNFLRAIVAAAALISGQVLAQTPPDRPPFSALGGYVSLSATNSAARTALPASVVAYSAVTLYNSGAKTAYFAIGDVTVVASATTPFTNSSTVNGAGAIPGGTRMTVWAPGAYISVITGGSDTTTVQLWQGSGPLEFGLVGGSGGGGGATTCGGLSDSGYFCSGTDASNLTGTVASARLSGAYGGITGVGTLASGAVPTTLLTGALQAAQFPALTGDVTTTAGSLATTLAASISGAKTFSTSITIGAGSAITSSGPGGALTAVAYSSFGTASGNAAQGGVITAGGPTGSATVAPIITYNAAGQLTVVTSATIMPAIGSVTGIGTGGITALGVNVGTAGAFVTFNGAGGTPSSMVGTNITGTAAGLTAGTVTTNANLTGDVTSSGNATTLVTAQTGAHSWSALQTYSAGETNSTSATSGNSAKQFTGTLLTGAGTTNTLPQMLFQPTGTAARTDYNTAGTMIGANLVSGSTADFLNFGIGGAASVFKITNIGTLVSSGSVTITSGNLTVGSGNIVNWNGRGILSSPAAGGVQFGNGDAASPVAQTVSFQNATGTNTAAATQATMQGPLSTGTGAAGAYNISTGFAGFTTSALAVTFTNGSANIAATAHGAVPGQPVTLAVSGGTLPTNFATATTYYVLSTGLTTNQVNLSATPGGAAIVAGSAGSGSPTITFATTVQNQASTVATFGPSGLTGSQTTSALNLAQVWNTSGTPTALLVNVNNIASSGIPKLIDLQILGASKFNVTGTGGTTAIGGLTVPGQVDVGFVNNGLTIAGTRAMVWGSSGFTTPDTGLSRDSAGVIDVGTGAQGSKAGSMNMTNLNLVGSGQLNVAAMTQTAVAQSGTVCYNSGTGAVTYDSTVGCLTSTMTEKDNWQDITPQQALAVVLKMQAGSYTYKKGRGLPEGPQVGLSAEQIETLDDRLVGHRPNGDLAGVRYQQASALYPMAIQQLKSDNDNLRAELLDLQLRVAR